MIFGTDLETESNVLLCQPCEQPATYESIIDNFCQSDFGG